MVIALLRYAEARGATLFPRIAATHAERAGGGWRITLSDERTVEARHLVNATGPWAERTAREIMQVEDLPALRLRSEEHTSELQSLMRISYAVFCLKKKNKKDIITQHNTRLQ